MTPQHAKTNGHRAGQLLDWQLRTTPVINAAAKIEDRPDGTKLVKTKAARRKWLRLLKPLLPLRTEVTLELDALASETLELIEDRCTVAQIVDHFQARWKLSFFEARRMVYDFMKVMVRRQVVILNAPTGPEAKGGD